MLFRLRGPSVYGILLGLPVDGWAKWAAIELTLVKAVANALLGVIGIDVATELGRIMRLVLRMMLMVLIAPVS